MSLIERMRQRQQQITSVTPPSKRPAKLKLPPKPARESMLPGEQSSQPAKSVDSQFAAAQVAELGPRQGKQRGPGRLPDGATFNVKYNGNAVEWSGTLTIPVAGEEVTFEGSAPSLFGLEGQLDSKYRRWARSQPRKGAGHAE
jgi:hypothetical protein